MRLLFVYKQNPQDPCELALRGWLPESGPTVSFFEILPGERSRTSSPQDDRVFARLRASVEQFQPTHVLLWVPYLTLEEVRWLRARGVRVAQAINGAASFSTALNATSDGTWICSPASTGTLSRTRPTFPSCVLGVFGWWRCLSSTIRRHIARFPSGSGSGTSEARRSSSSETSARLRISSGRIASPLCAP